MDRINKALPDMAPDGPLDTEQKGTLSVIGDPLGIAVKTTLKPTVGVLTAGVGEPSAEAAQNLHKVARKEVGLSQEDNDKPDSELPGGERVGGNIQTGQNPLGL